MAKKTSTKKPAKARTKSGPALRRKPQRDELTTEMARHGVVARATVRAAQNCWALYCAGLGETSAYAHCPVAVVPDTEEGRATIQAMSRLMPTITMVEPITILRGPWR